MVACKAPIGIPTIEEVSSEAIMVEGGTLRFTFKGRGCNFLYNFSHTGSLAASIIKPSGLTEVN